MKTWLVLISFCTLLSTAAFGQAPGDDGSGGGGGQAATAQGADARYELGFHLGDLLPNQVPGVTEIMGLGGVRAGIRMAPLSYAEAGIIMGNGDGAQWKNVHVDVRMDMPIENLVGIAYVGADTYYYKGAGTASNLRFGGHVGGGVQTHLTGFTWFRTDMKFGFNPGTSLYFGFGLEFRLGGGGQGGGA